MSQNYLAEKVDVENALVDRGGRYIKPYAFEYRPSYFESMQNYLANLGNEMKSAMTSDQPVENLPFMMDTGILGIMAGPKASGFANAKGKFSALFDKKPRFEIDDSGMKLKIPAYKFGRLKNPKKLEDIIDHPTLFENYPELKKISVQPGSSNPYSSNYINGKNSDAFGTITIGKKAAYQTVPEFSPDGTIRVKSGDEGLKEKLLHEIQHAVQGKEDFAKGGVTAQFDELPVTTKEAVIGADIGNITHPNEWKQIFGPENPLGIAVSAKELAKRGLLSKPEIAQLEKVAGKHGFKSFDDMADYLRLQADFRSPEGQYQRLAGEIEARDVAARANLTAEQRVKTPPYNSEDIPIENYLVRFAAD